MQRVLRELRALLRDTRGETLFQSVISILIFTILLVAVSTVILVAMRITGSANARSRVMQGEANAAMIGEEITLMPGDTLIEVDSDEDEIVFAFVDADGEDVEFPIPVTIYKSYGPSEPGEAVNHSFIAFEATASE